MKLLKSIFSVLILMVFVLLIVGCKKEEVTYTVTFNSDGGSVVESQTIKEGELAVKPANPTKEGYTFVDWYNGEAAFSFETAITADLELTAKWEENVPAPEPQIFTVEFVTNGDTEVSNQMIGEGGKVLKPTDPAKTGYTFLGWYDGETLWDFETVVTSDLTLTAKWEQLSYTITFNSDGGSSVDSQTVNYNEKITKPTDPTKEGFVFVGWYDGETLWNFNLLTVKKDITLTAKWEEEGTNPPAPNTFTVTFNSNGGSNVASQNIEEGGVAVKPTDPTQTGYAFLGWYDGTTLFDFNTVITANITLTAKWEAINRTVTFNSDGGSDVSQQIVLDGSKATKPTNPTKEGFTFDGWYDGTVLFNFNTAITSDITLIAKWTPITYKVTFNSDGGSNVDNQIVDYNGKAIKPTDPTKGGYTFIGWYLENAAFDFDTVLTGDLILTAHWEEDLTNNVVTAVYITLNTKTYAYASSSGKYTATMRANDWINIVIDINLEEGFIFGDEVVLYVNDVQVDTSTYSISGDTITYTTDDPNWSAPF